MAKNKKGVSVIVGYVLLVVFAIVIGAGVYAWLKTYVPADILNCPDGVSLFVKDTSFNSESSHLNVTIRNNGRFDVAGYFIHATNSSTQQLPSIDLSGYLNENNETVKFGNSVLLSVTGSNSLKPGQEKKSSFSIPSAIGNIYSVRVIPTRFQEENNRERFVSCGNARVLQTVSEPGVTTTGNCEGADFVVPVDMDVQGNGCGTPTQDSTSINVATPGRYNLKGLVERGSSSQCQTNEDFFLEVNGETGPETEDDADPCAITERIDDLGSFNFNSGDNVVIMHTAAQCPPDTTANSVYLKEICFYSASP